MAREVRREELAVGMVLVAKRGGGRYTITAVQPGPFGAGWPYLSLRDAAGVASEHDTSYDAGSATYTVEEAVMTLDELNALLEGATDAEKEKAVLRTILERVLPADLREAISLKCANCYGAMAAANRIGGANTLPWMVCHLFGLKDLLDTATARGVSLAGLKSAVDELPVEETMYYKRAAGVWTEDEFRAAFARWKRGEKP